MWYVKKIEQKKISPILLPLLLMIRMLMIHTRKTRLWMIWMRKILPRMIGDNQIII